MSADLDERLGAFVALTPPQPFRPAEEVRRRGRQRQRRQVGVAGTAALVALATAGLVVGGPLYRPHHVPPPYAGSGGGTSGGSAAAPISTVTIPYPIPVVPDRLFLRQSDFGGSYEEMPDGSGTVYEESTVPLPCPDFAAGANPGWAHRVDEGARLFHNPAAPHPHDDDVWQKVHTFPPGWAAQAMDDLDAALPHCFAVTRGKDFAGQQARLIEVTDRMRNVISEYLVVVRVGDLVTTIQLPADIDLDFARGLGRAAAIRLASGR
jgi:hypothetical protein